MWLIPPVAWRRLDAHLNLLACVFSVTKKREKRQREENVSISLQNLTLLSPTPGLYQTRRSGSTQCPAIFVSYTFFFLRKREEVARGVLHESRPNSVTFCFVSIRYVLCVCCSLDGLKQCVHCGRYWNRDVGAARNIGWVFVGLWVSGIRPSHLRRHPTNVPASAAPPPPSSSVCAGVSSPSSSPDASFIKSCAASCTIKAS